MSAQVKYDVDRLRKLEALTSAFNAKQQAMQNLDDELKRLFPVGSTTEWERGGHIQSGDIASFGWGDRILVVNHKTAKPVWINSYNILSAYVLKQNGAGA